MKVSNFTTPRNEGRSAMKAFRTTLLVAMVTGLMAGGVARAETADSLEGEGQFRPQGRRVQHGD
jgi:hypothetical protein